MSGLFHDSFFLLTFGKNLDLPLLFVNLHLLADFNSVLVLLLILQLLLAQLPILFKLDNLHPPLCFSLSLKVLFFPADFYLVCSSFGLISFFLLQLGLSLRLLIF